MTDFKDIGKIYDDFFGSPVSSPDPQKDPDGTDAGAGSPSLSPTNDSKTESILHDIEQLRKMIAEDEAFLGSGKNVVPDTDQNSAGENGAHQDGTGEKGIQDDAGGKRAAQDTTEGDSSGKKEERPPMEELEELIGLESIKKDVKELIDLVKAQRLRTEQGMKTVPVSLHLVFSGNPGTGKTTVARILARLYKEIGALSKGQLVEVDRSGLVAGFVGQTALRTQEKIQEAMGGVLFIDEAYTLAKEGNDFGQEAIDTILKAMEDHRDDLVVIVAGYTDLMEKFINSNPGLKSRFNKYFEFPDYTADELFSIFELQCAKYDYCLDPEARSMVREKIDHMEAEKGENFANARDVRNLFEQIITRQATRIAREEAPDADQLRIILSADI